MAKQNAYYDQINPYRQYRPTKIASPRKSGFVLGCSLFFIIMVVGAIFVVLASWWSINPIHVDNTVKNGYRINNYSFGIEGHPTITVDLINRILDYYGSPAQGKGQALYDYGVQYNIDPIFALAFFRHESSMGTKGVAAHTHSLGNIRVTPGYNDYQGYRSYASWEDGFEDWYKLIRKEYIERRGLTSIDTIIPVYAPSDDNNDVEAYIDSIKASVNGWRQGQDDS